MDHMPLGTKIGLGPGDIVLDGYPAPPRKGAEQPLAFRSMSIAAKQQFMSATAELLFGLLLESCIEAVRVEKTTHFAVCTVSHNDLTSPSLNCFTRIRLFRCETGLPVCKSQIPLR